jgi:glycosyl transferase family 25
MVPVFCINRVVDTERRIVMDRQFSRADIQAVYVPGLTGGALPRNLQSYFPPSKLTYGEVGCYASHMSIWQKIAEGDIPHALILEDDARLCPDFSFVVSEIISKAPKGWEFIHLGMPPNRAYLEIEPLTYGRAIIRYSRVPMRTNAYLLSFDGAMKLLRPRPRIHPVDSHTRRPWIFDVETYGVDPCPVAHPADAKSTVGHTGARHSYQTHTLESLAYNIKKLGPTKWGKALLLNATRKLRGSEFKACRI